MGANIIAATSPIDSTHVDAIVGLVGEVLGLFTIFPLNIFLVLGIIVGVIGIIPKLKRTTK